MTTTDTAAAIIATARNRFDRGAAGFDWAIAGNDHAAEQALENAAYRIANKGHTDLGTGCADGSYAGADIDRTRTLLASVATELDAYRARCRERKYTGWSTASTGPIRYAN